MTKCIFKADELNSLCEMVRCPDGRDKCVTKAYCNLIEEYVKLKEVSDALRKEKK